MAWMNEQMDEGSEVREEGGMEAGRGRKNG